MLKTRSGFTIVELLIVIVVIAILAAISIVAYNGIQERARMSSAKSFSSQLMRSPDIADATAIYSFDDCSGATVKDSSDKANNGTIVGTVAWSNSDTPSGSGCALSFNGSTRIETDALIGASFYIKSAWVKMTSCGSNNIISSASGSGSAFYSCNLSAGHNGSWSAISNAANLNDGKWHHVMLKYENATLTAYIDGRQVANATSVSAPNNLSSRVGSLGTANYFTGLMDDVIIIAR